MRQFTANGNLSIPSRRPPDRQRDDETKRSRNRRSALLSLKLASIFTHCATCLIFSHFILSYSPAETRPPPVAPSPRLGQRRAPNFLARAGLNRICECKRRVSWPRKALSSSRRFVDNVWWESRSLSSSSPFFRSHCSPQTFRFPENVLSSQRLVTISSERFALLLAAAFLPFL